MKSRAVASVAFAGVAQAMRIAHDIALVLGPTAAALVFLLILFGTAWLAFFAWLFGEGWK